MSPKSPVERYQALLAAARCFGEAMDLSALIDEILRRAEEVMNAEGCSLLLPDARTGELILHSTNPWIAHLPEPLRVPAGAGIAGAVFQSRQILNIKDAANDSRYYSAIANQLGKVTRAILSIPLLNGASCLGVLQALNPREQEWFSSEDEEILVGFGGLIVNALVRLEAQRREIEQAASRQQLLLAREIQDTFLPPPVNRFPFCHVYHQQLPAQTVSGDFGFIHPVSASRWLLGLSDVSGKGFPAALTMARATAVIEAMIDQLQDDLGEWLAKLNRVLVRELKSGRFITFTVLLADADSETLQICTAGQDAPLHCNGQKWERSDVENHMPLGISAAAAYKAKRINLRPGDSWLLFTDGFPESRNPQGDEYSTERFLRSLPVGETAAQTLGVAFQAWNAFRDSAPQHDDASLLLLDWRGRPPAHEFFAICAPAQLIAIRDFVERWAVFAGFGDIVVGQIVMACDEAATNIFRHGYKEKPGPIRVVAEITRTALVLQFIDDAPPVDVREIQGRELSDLRPGGLGTFVMEKVFDEVNFAVLGKGNSLSLRKKLPATVG